VGATTPTVPGFGRKRVGTNRMGAGCRVGVRASFQVTAPAPTAGRSPILVAWTANVLAL
jgi:hypothetical protein